MPSTHPRASNRIRPVQATPNVCPHCGHYLKPRATANGWRKRPYVFTWSCEWVTCRTPGFGSNGIPFHASGGDRHV